MSIKQTVEIIFCADPLNGRQPDLAYQTEAEAAEQLGIRYHLIDYEALVDERDPLRAVRRVPELAESTQALYRGWMLQPKQYGQLLAALAARGITLINDPAAYAHCHELPNWYPQLERWTPRSTWLKTQGAVSSDELDQLLEPFHGSPIIGLREVTQARVDGGLLHPVVR